MKLQQLFQPTSQAKPTSPAQPTSPVKLILIVTASLAVGAGLAYAALRYQSTTTTSAPVPIASHVVPKSVAASGFLEPKGEVIKLSAPVSTQGARIDQLLIAQGDTVKPKQVIATLNTHDQLKAALEQAQQQVLVAQAKLVQVQAGAKRGDIGAQADTIARLEAELANAQLEAKRSQALYKEGAVSASALDSKRLTEDTARAQLQAAKNTLNSVAEVRPVDVQVAQAEVQQAIAAVKQADAQYEQSLVRSPQAARILKIYARPGELIGNDGIVDIGQTGQMYARAQVYETDIGRVKVGQTATVQAKSVVGALHGIVDEVGLQIGRKNVLGTDPVADADSRVVEVKIRLLPDDSQRVAGLSNLEVDVVINTSTN